MTDVYVAGYVGNTAAHPTARVWKNGVATELAVGDDRAASFSMANAVFVSGDDVYAVGVNDSAATIWKNGAAAALSDTTQIAIASAVAVSQGDVYVLGSRQGGMGQGPVPMVWRNRVATDLAGGCCAASIAISGPDVYVAGYDFQLTAAAANDKARVQGSSLSAVVWRNGVATQFPSPSLAYSVAVSRGNVYVAGYTIESGRDIATLWKNGTPKQLSRNSSQATLMAVSGGDVYTLVQGGDSGGAELWKNGAFFEVLRYDGQASSMAVSGSDVYLAGTRSVCPPLPDSPKLAPAPECTLVATLWKNGVAMPLSIETTGDSAAKSVFVYSH